MSDRLRASKREGQRSPADGPQQKQEIRRQRGGKSDDSRSTGLVEVSVLSAIPLAALLIFAPDTLSDGVVVREAGYLLAFAFAILAIICGPTLVVIARTRQLSDQAPGRQPSSEMLADSMLNGVAVAVMASLGTICFLVATLTPAGRLELTLLSLAYFAAEALLFSRSLSILYPSPDGRSSTAGQRGIHILWVVFARIAVTGALAGILASPATYLLGGFPFLAWWALMVSMIPEYACMLAFDMPRIRR